jgi:hypothetical protein
MARIRTIKPEFWVDDQIVELDFTTRLLFIGLWNFVDDEGYIEFKPKRIKMQVFPADDLDVSEILRNLLEASRIELFDSEQGQLLKITNWDRHQKISHPTPTRFTGIERASSLSAPELSGSLRNVPDRSALKGKEGKGKEGKGDVPEIRADVSSLCELLADLIEENGSIRPNIGQGWHDSARLLLDKDKRPYEQIEILIRWCQHSSFWRANVLSMPKFRDQFDKLRLARNAELEKNTPAPKKNPDAWMNQ